MTDPSMHEQGSYLTPSLEHALVADAMRHGILTCFPDTSPRAAARTMALHHIHTIVVSDPDDGGLVGVVSDRDLLAVLEDGAGGGRELADIARHDFLTVSSDARLADAAAAMRQRGTAHALVIDAHSGRPSGMLSTLDVLGVLAWGEA